MNNDIKLIMMDMDGTLLNGQGRISENNKTALKAVRKAGVGITLVTGRMHMSTTWAAKVLELDIPFASYNGALITEPRPPYRELLHHRITDDQTRKIISLLKPFNTHLNAYINDDLFVEEKSPEIEEYARVRDAEYSVVGSFDNIPRLTCTKLLVIEERADVMEELRKVLLEQSGAEVLISTHNYCEIVPKGINKGTALDFFADHLGIPPSRIMAMGDQGNDLGMLKKAGISVAMGNAREDVKKAVDWVSTHHNDDGVAEAIAHFFPDLLP